jgi:molybdenum cofactor biosynthesis protein B
MKVATISFSDSRDEAADLGGRTLRDELERAGFSLAAHRLVREDLEGVRAAILRACGEADAVVTTGGTGLGPRDVTIAALESLQSKRLDGFGEAFRRLSFDEVGARAILSNASAGLVGTVPVFALPGSPKALPLAVRSLLQPTLAHAVKVARGSGHDDGPSKGDREC